MAMMVIIGLLVLLAAAVVGVAGFLSNRGSSHRLGGDFTILGQHLSGLSTGHLFLYGIIVGVVGMLGLSLLLRPVTGWLASRGTRQELKGSRRETEAAQLDRERLAQQLDEERTARLRAAEATEAPTPGTPEAGQPAVDSSGAQDPAPGGDDRPRNVHRRDE